MYPEQRLLVIHEYLAVEVKILLLRAVIGMLSPERMCIIKGNRALNYLKLLLRGRNLDLLLGAVFFFLLLVLCLLVYLLDYNVLIRLVCRVYGLILGLGAFLLEEDRNRHE